ncbi:hypothetical protein [Actinoplanes sp. RD1]|uniref:hypothetical protein n=1 Tax=Actinoplanes sp. RD1 TaxID=3064538 RepID=UPI002742940F|nr:hypothetical protein [Actinoplanes sp. RD1]
MINRRPAVVLLSLVPLLAVAATTGCSASDPVATTPAAAPATTAPASTPATTAPASTPATTTPATTTPAATTVASPSTSPAGKDGAPVGRIIHTGLDATPITEFAIQGVRVANPNLPGVTFGFQLLEYENNGDSHPYVLTSATEDEKKPGFRAVEHSYALDGDVQQPAFGYYAGRPAKITGTLRGKAVTAHTAVWSADSGVTVFWFDNTQVTGADRLTRVQAYGTAGNRIAQATVSYE